MQRFALILLFALSACAHSAAFVPALRETAAVTAVGDAADDPAIWVAPAPEDSLVIATQKQGGIYVFNLAGAIVQEVPGGRPNNVDLRDAFAWADGASPIAGASDRSDNTIVLWRFDAVQGRLEPGPRARLATGFVEIYGFCLGRMENGFIAIATDKGGEVGVWRIVQNADGALTGARVAAYHLGSIAEGCVVDDEAGVYYIAQETVGIWRVSLADPQGERRQLIDRTGEGGNLAADVEGLALWRGLSGAGYLIASSQGDSRFAVYNRGDNTYRGSFRIGRSINGQADAVQGTDGIDAVSTPLGDDLSQGLFVTQDDANTAPSALQNFKYVSWAEVASALGLEP